MGSKLTVEELGEWLSYSYGPDVEADVSADGTKATIILPQPRPIEGYAHIDGGKDTSSMKG